MPSIFNMPPLGIGFNLSANGMLGQGNIALNDRLGGTNSGLQRTLRQLSGGTDVINAMQNTLSANPQAVMILTGTTGNAVQPPGTIGIQSPPSATPTVPKGSLNPHRLA